MKQMKPNKSTLHELSFLKQGKRQGKKKTYTVIIFAYRKPDTTPAHFKTMYESKHIPLVQSITGSLFPLSHTRRYLARAECSPQVGSDKSTYPAAVLVGGQADFDYDAIAELLFQDQAAFQAFFAKVSEPANAQKLAEDEDLFLDRSRMRAVALDDTVVTTAHK
jgi:EthD domain